MAAGLQSFDRCSRCATLDIGTLALEEEPWRIDRLLHIHPIVEHVENNLDMTHGLIVRAHHAEAHVAAAVPHCEGRNDRVHRALVGTKRVRMIRLEREAGPAIGQHDARPLRADADTEARVERVDERDRPAITVDDSEINRIVARRRCARQLRPLFHVDQRRKSFAEAFIEQSRHRHAHVRVIGNMSVADRVAEPGRFEHKMKPIGTEGIKRGHIEVFQDVEHHKGGEPLPVRRNFQYVKSAIIG